MTLLTAMAILCLVASQRRDIARTISTYRWLAYSGSLVAAFGIFQLYWWPEGLQTYAGLEMIVPRARAFFAEANEFSQFLVLPFAFSLVLLLFAPAIRWFERICLIAGIIIIICAQLLTFSRGGILSFVVESAVIIVISMRVNSKRYPKSASKLTRLLVVLTVCVAVWAFSAWFMESSIGIIWERISVLFSGSDPTSGIRWDNYLDATRGLTVTPLGALTGIGFGNLPTVLQDGVATTANFLVDIYTETGLFGAIAYIVILYQVVNIGLRSIVFSRSTDRSRYLAAAGPLVALCGLIAGGLTYATHMLNFSWFICGMLFALSISSTTTRESDSPVPALQ